MAQLPKKTIQKLAVLYALSLWKKGACGPVRVHKTLFFAENDLPRHLFTFKRYHYGQYSKEIDAVLNSLQESGRLKVHFDGAAARLQSSLAADAANHIEFLFSHHSPEWLQGLKAAIQQFGYLKNDELIRRAHEDDSYTDNEHDELIHESTLDSLVNLPNIDAELAERLSDIVDERLTTALTNRFKKAMNAEPRHLDWQVLFVGDNEQ
jgi:hypothetical protein